MSPEKQRIAIAMATGIETFPAHEWDERDDRRYFVCTRCDISIGWSKYSKHIAPFADPCSGTELDFQNSLDAMQEAWLWFSRIHQQARFYVELKKIVERDMPGENVGLSDIVNAVATQRAEAFLRAIEKWET